MKLTLDEYSKHFNITKDVIYSKLRTKKLDYAVENGIVYIIDNSNTDLLDKQKTTIATIITLYKKENRQLKEKIVQLENKIDKLIADKEKMFKDEISKIETLHALKDKQLKNILELINTKLTLEQKKQTIHEIESLEYQTNDTHIIELKSYLKTLDLKPYQKKVIKKRFLASYNKDIRIIKQNGKVYLDFSKYDYSDLLEY